MTKKTIKIITGLIIILLIIFILFKVIKVQEIILKSIYPTKYSEYVEKYSQQNGLDKYLVYATIKQKDNLIQMLHQQVMLED